MNALQHETSPYLLQHAANPVDWMPWGDEAFKKAASENKPLLISIGYSSCHWCDVMEHESFEDEETAALMNALFVNIKVDREEYPDVDHMYMDAVQAMTGSGGWPLNIFVTSEKKPFYGGTYFPPARAYGRASWKEVLVNVSQYFSQNREDVEQQASKLLDHLKESSQLSNNWKEQEESVVRDAEDSCVEIKNKIMANADKEDGGFGMAPKFPSTFNIRFLLDHYVLYNDQEALQQALLSLDKMMMGGIYDQIGGGFSRYSTDKLWIAPHFEKMLYDNALLIEVFAIAFSITGNAVYSHVIKQTVDWLQREMSNVGGGFYSAQDADSEGVEGKYYTWSYTELKELLKEDFEWFVSYYHVEENGNWSAEHAGLEHTNILYTSYEKRSALEPANQLKLLAIHEQLSQIRNQRIKPMTDDKILLGWNALMCKGLVTAYTFTGEAHYLELAEKNMHFLLREFAHDKHLFFHTWKENKPKIPAYLDDLAYLADALLSLGNATADATYYYKAKDIVVYCEAHFSEDENCMFNFTNTDFVQVEINKKELYDGATPSPNSILSNVLRKLYLLFFEEHWKKRSDEMLRKMAAFLLQSPSSFAIWCAAFQNKHSSAVDVTILGPDAKKIYQELNTKKYKPDVSYITTHKEEAIISFQGKYQVGENLIYICRDFNCLQPLRDINEAFTEIHKTEL